MGEKGSACGVVVGKSEGSRSLGSVRHKWEDNIKMVLKEMGQFGLDSSSSD
jgi:hypothetical protein